MGLALRDDGSPLLDVTVGQLVRVESVGQGHDIRSWL